MKAGGSLALLLVLVTALSSLFVGAPATFSPQYRSDAHSVSLVTDQGDNEQDTPCCHPDMPATGQCSFSSCVQGVVTASQRQQALVLSQWSFLTLVPTSIETAPEGAGSSSGAVGLNRLT